jgi:hypothetical protein
MSLNLKMIIVSLVGGVFALAANLIAFTIIDQINQKVPTDQRVGFFLWGTEIKKKHRALYPDSKLVLAMNICGNLMAVTFLVLSWFVFHSK